MTPTRAGASAVMAVLGATVLLLVLVTWAASIGPDGVLRAPGLPAGTAVGPTASPSAESGAEALLDKERRAHEHDGPAPAWLRLLAAMIELALAGFAVLLASRLGRTLIARWRGRRRPPERNQEAVDFETLESRPALARAIDADADWQRTVLETGEPRNAIVACWDRFETAAERVGVRRRTAQTSSEFVLEVLDRAGADPDAVIRLADLYREARFSDHPVTEDHRRQAFDALEATHRSLHLLPAGRG